MSWFEHALELVENCLNVDPVKRLPANQLLLHPFFDAADYTTTSPHQTTAQAEATLDTPHHTPETTLETPHQTTETTLQTPHQTTSEAALETPVTPISATTY